jgi:hypothetical protein
MRITRTNSVFRCFYSYDGVTWTNYVNLDTANTGSLGGGSTTTFAGAWPNLVCVGIAVTAHNNGDPGGATATIAHLTSNFSGHYGTYRRQHDGSGLEYHDPRRKRSILLL